MRLLPRPLLRELAALLLVAALLAGAAFLKRGWP